MGHVEVVRAEHVLSSAPVRGTRRPLYETQDKGRRADANRNS
jgi:hypothetical protein